MTALVDGFSREAVAVARLLAGEGRTVCLAGPGPAPPEALLLREQGVDVVEHVDLDTAPLAADVAYLDVWTPEVAPRVSRLRASGVWISSIGDLVLERSSAPVVGITGTAGKTTTTGLVAHLLEAAGIAVLSSDASPNGNRWPDAALLEGAVALPPRARLVVELTSSHLAFMSASPSVAVVTTFWPDHVELHGSLEAYRAAKETIVRHQRPGDHVVVDVTSPEVASFALSTPAVCVGFSSKAAGGAVVARIERETVVLETAAGSACAMLPAGAAYRGARAVNVAAACAAALAVGAPPGALAEALSAAPPPPFRLRDIGRVRGARVLDDGMAATPAKACATLSGFGERSIVLVCGGDDAPDSGAVHASLAEQEALRRACDEGARVARVAVVFGPAGARLHHLLTRRGVEVVLARTFDDAVGAAVERLRGDDALVLAPMFPVAAADRLRFAALTRAHA